MSRFAYVIAGLTILLTVCAVGSGSERFPPPDFESDYERPSVALPSPRQTVYEYVDVAVLFVALCLSSYLVLKKRSRRAIFALMVFSLLYFGFWRKGCVCSIGAVQNVTLSIFEASYAIPITVVAFFFLPLVFTLFFGRTFCAGVCPLGAVQDLVLLRPVAVPNWLESGLRLFAYVYLGAAVLFAATGSAFIICRYDPFVAFFRLSGNFNIIVLGACFLVVGIFVGRPYCRYFCPYSVLLRQVSRLSKWRVSITPDECIQCRLCEDSCPFGAIRAPATDWSVHDYDKSKKRLAFLIVLVPIFVLACGWVASRMRHVTSRMHPEVRLAERVHLEETGLVEGTTDASDAFWATGRPVDELYGQASAIRAKLGAGGWLFGGFVGLVIGFKLIAVSLRWERKDYEADKAGCIACGRCFEYCPREQVRLKKARETEGAG